MNLFVLDRDPRLAALAHCDKHVVKMVLETAQLLSTALAHFGEASFSDVHNCFEVRGQRIYHPTHQNHPCSVWVRETAANYHWAYSLLEALLHEYQRRFGDRAKKRHKTWDMLPALCTPPRALLRACADRPDAMTPFALAIPEAYRSPDPVASYRAYYRADKSVIAEYHMGDEPEWMARAPEVSL